MPAGCLLLSFLCCLFISPSALTVGLERYIVHPPGVDFGQILMSQHDGGMSHSSRTSLYLLILCLLLWPV